MIYRQLEISRETRDLLQAALTRRALAMPLGPQHYMAMETVVTGWDAAAVEVEVAETE